MRLCGLIFLFVFCGSLIQVAAEELPSWRQDVGGIVERYCAGCHNQDDAEGDLAFESYADLVIDRDGKSLVRPGDVDGSLLMGVITGSIEPKMPPEDEAQPTDEEIALLKAWIQRGAPEGKTNSAAEKNNVPTLRTPRLAPSLTPKPITSLAYSPDGRWLAIGRFQSVDLVTAADQRFVRKLDEHPGKVNDIRFSADGRYLITATGIGGVFGEAQIWEVRTGRLLRRLGEHRDVLYAAAISDDSKIVATAGYDRLIRIWDLASGKRLHELEGHNGPVYDLDFSPDGKLLASASADATIKVWDVATGQRFDTLNQPSKEQYSVDISPDGRFITAAGEDNRIRQWRLVSVDKPQINPLLVARFAHEQAIGRVRYTQDGQQIVSLSDDRRMKVWDAATLTQQQVVDIGGEVAQAVALQTDSRQVAIGRMDGAILVESLKVASGSSPRSESQARHASTPHDLTSQEVNSIQEQEPNDQPSDAALLQIPAQVSGHIWKEDATTDLDLFRFSAKQGQSFVLETIAARDKSPLDSKIRVLDTDGNLVPRVLLRAVRDSYFTFRGKNSSATGDFRLHNWEEMGLNQYLYAAGEVVKLYHYPRGPDSGFNVYPNFGKRHTYFDTTSVTHALHAPCYIVEPHQPGQELPPNGLPTFLVSYENDDESRGKFGNDSYLIFTAPADGEYLVQVEDVRGQQASDYQYQLSIRPPRPDFKISVSGANPSVPRGAGRKFGFDVERLDGFEGEIIVEVDGLPPGFSVSQPIVIEAEHLRAWGTITASADAQVDEETAKQSRVRATAVIDGKKVTRDVGTLGEIKLADAPQLDVHFSSAGETTDLPIIEIEAGTTTTAHIRIERKGHNGRVGFGKEEAVVNAPHGVYVNNTGLNGVLITESQNERTIFITAEPWVEDCERLVFVQADAGGSPTSKPVLLRVIGRQTSE
ncbi:MAG: hypothetical protein CMJ77_19540 [Planctomycetaceae bacterium]|nr:hypothetical protein [Planctomycetaceae bacterium]